jgi:hypothetical protein
LAKARAAAYWEKNASSGYDLADLQIEAPYRLHQQLRTLAQSLAMVHSRLTVTEHEIELIKRVAWSTIPADRRMVLTDLCSRDLSRQDMVDLLGKSPSRAGQILDELQYAKLIEETEGSSNGGRPPKVYSLVPGIAELKPLSILDHVADLA